MLLLSLLNSPSICEGQGQSNSHQLFCFFSEIVGQVGAGFILIRETNGRRHVGGILGENFCSYYEQVEEKGTKRRSKYERTAQHMIGAGFNVKEQHPI